MLQVSSSELAARRRELFVRLHERTDASVAILFRPASIQYFTGFCFIPTERPLAVVLESDLGAWAFVPRLEREHLHENARLVDDVVSYDDYPGEQSPMAALVDALRGRRHDLSDVAADSDGYPGPYGYRGATLSELLPATRVVPCTEQILRMRQIKSEQEIALLREAATWVELAQRYLQELVSDGAAETEISLAASLRASSEMLAAFGSRYHSTGAAPASIGFRSQIGPNSALPHAVPRQLAIRAGDVLIGGGVATVGGLRCGIERTMIVGQPSAEQRRFFDLMLRARELALSKVRPGAPCSGVDRIVRRFFRDEGIEDYWRHHTGHGVGTELHEPPYLDVGEEEELRPGMVFSVDPGIYVPELGGFRHQDTVVLTEAGFELLNAYPRELDALVCDPAPATLEASAAALSAAPWTAATEIAEEIADQARDLRGLRTAPLEPNREMALTFNPRRQV